MRNKDTANAYRAKIERNIGNINKETNQDHWKSLCINSSEQFKPPRIKPGLAYNEEINILSNHQKNLRLRIEKEKNEEKVKLLKLPGIKLYTLSEMFKRKKMKIN